MSSSRTTEEENEALSRAAQATELLYQMRDRYFPSNPDEKNSKLLQDSGRILKLIDSIPLEKRSAQQAKFEYLRGKVLDVTDDYKKEAEDHLSKAVELNPTLTDAWLCLSNCITKKGDLLAAKECLYLAMDNVGSDKNILCQLSMLKGKIVHDVENQEEIADQSIQHAKDAITLDVKDGNSWYCLGNAYLTSYFAGGSWDHTTLSHSLKAYQNAEKDERMKSNPDLYFNCATVNKFLENYQSALIGFEAAAVKDPGLGAAEEIQKIVNLLDKVDNLLREHVDVKGKGVASLTQSLAAVNLESSKGTQAIQGKVLCFVENECESPLYYLLSDTNQSCFVLSVYGVRDDVINEGDQLVLINPYFQDIDFSWKEKRYMFKSVRVDFFEQVIVNGKALSLEQSVQTTICP